MANWGYVDSAEMKAFQEKLEQFAEIDKDTFCREAAKNLAARLLRGAIENTPVKSGQLKKAWKCDYKVVYRGNEYRITVYNPQKYASYVEWGHRQEVGKYIPKLGKRLKKGWVDGKFMLTNAEKDLNPKVPAILEQQLQKKLERIFK